MRATFQVKQNGQSKRDNVLLVFLNRGSAQRTPENDIFMRQVLLLA